MQTSTKKIGFSFSFFRPMHVYLLPNSGDALAYLLRRQPSVCGAYKTQG